MLEHEWWLVCCYLVPPQYATSPHTTCVNSIGGSCVGLIYIYLDCGLLLTGSPLLIPKDTSKTSRVGIPHADHQRANAVIRNSHALDHAFPQYAPSDYRSPERSPRRKHTAPSLVDFLYHPHQKYLGNQYTALPPARRRLGSRMLPDRIGKLDIRSCIHAVGG